MGQEVSVAASKYHIKLQVPTAEGMTDLVLKCDTVRRGRARALSRLTHLSLQEHQFAKWMSACRLASRGKTMADASYNGEVETLKKTLLMQAGRECGARVRAYAQRARMRARLQTKTAPRQRSARRPCSCRATSTWRST